MFCESYAGLYEDLRLLDALNSAEYENKFMLRKESEYCKMRKCETLESLGFDFYGVAKYDSGNCASFVGTVASNDYTVWLSAGDVCGYDEDDIKFEVSWYDDEGCNISWDVFASYASARKFALYLMESLAEEPRVCDCEESS